MNTEKIKKWIIPSVLAVASLGWGFLLLLLAKVSLAPLQELDYKMGWYIFSFFDGFGSVFLLPFSIISFIVFLILTILKKIPLFIGILILTTNILFVFLALQSVLFN